MTVRLSSTKVLTAAESTTVLNRSADWLAGVTPARTLVDFAASPYTVLATDVVLGVTTAGGPVGVSLMAVPVARKMLWVVDEAGTAGASAITITPGAGHTINGGATLVLASARIAVGLYFDGTSDWKVVEQYKLPTPARTHDEQAIAATATTHAFIAPGAGRITAVRAFPGAAAAAGESLTVDAQIGGVSALTALATINNASALNVVAGTVNAAANTFAAGQVITYVRTYVAGGGPTPIVNTVAEISYELF